VGMLQNGAWLRHARHANAMAQLLFEETRNLEEAKILFPRQANSVFIELPEPVIKALKDRGWLFYNFIGRGGCRFMCSWDTTEEDVKAFAADLKAELSQAKLRPAQNE
jgi:threonine aldolase